MGEYAPDDQRDVHQAKSADWRDAEDGQQEQAEQKQAQQEQAKSGKTDADSDDGEQQARMGYGNARDADGQMEQARVNEGASEALPDDPVRPDVRARADAARPLGGD